MPSYRLLAVRHLQLAQSKHHYATIANDHWPAGSASSDSSYSGARQWPSPLSKPTPYQILSVQSSAPYTKHRFIELVKLYHPDRKRSKTSSPYHQLPEHIRLERYRLIVAAHALLSDPVKRAAYDAHGIGWLDGLEDSVLQRAAGGDSSRSAQAARAARGNATWEDWERWRQAHNADEHSTTSSSSSSSTAEQEGYFSSRYHAPQPVYMRNSRFFALLFLLSLGAGTAQTMHADRLTQAKRLLREERHWQATQDYQRSQEVARRMGREQRIEEFVRQRDPAVLTHPTLKGLVMDPDLCESGTVAGRSKELDMKRMFSKK